MDLTLDEILNQYYDIRDMMLPDLTSQDELLWAGPVPAYAWYSHKGRTPDKIAEARTELLTGPWPPDGKLPPAATHINLLTGMTMRARAAQADKVRDQLYVLEFQGPFAQYIKFGHTTRLEQRVDEISAVAKLHGFALLNGYATPAMADATPLETKVLSYAGHFEHERVHNREYFFGMPYWKALYLVWAVFHEARAASTGP